MGRIALATLVIGVMSLGVTLPLTLERMFWYNVNSSDEAVLKPQVENGMASQKRSGQYHRLEVAVTQVQRRWGTHALRLLPPTAAAPSPALSTGFLTLDTATGIGGLPRGQISEVIGPTTSGKTSLALSALAKAQRCGGIGAYFDPGRALDPEYAGRFGVDLHRLLLVHPPDGAEALAIAAALARRRGLQLQVFDLRPESWLPADSAGERRLALALRLFCAALASTPCVALFLTAGEADQDLSSAHAYPGQLPLPECAALRLRVTHEQWIQQPWEDVAGYEVTVAVVKNRLAAPGHQVKVPITFDRAVWERARDGEKP